MNLIKQNWVIISSTKFAQYHLLCEKEIGRISFCIDGSTETIETILVTLQKNTGKQSTGVGLGGYHPLSFV